MKKLKSLVAALLFAALSIPGSAQPGSGGWCANNNYSRLFNAKTMTEIEGTIVSVEKITPEKGMSVGVHLVVKTKGNETTSVHLGPSWYLDNQDVQFAADEAVEVKGSKVTYQNAPAIIAVTVTKGEQVLMLRDKNGFPKWNAWRKGKGGGRKNQKFK